MIEKCWNIFRGFVAWMMGVFRLVHRVSDLEKQLADLEQSEPPRPQELKLIDGIFWGRLTPEDHKQPFCPACVPQGLYTPLSREEPDPGCPNDQLGPTAAIAFRCPKCRWYDERTAQHETDGASS